MIIKESLLSIAYLVQCQLIVSELAKKARLRPFLKILLIFYLVLFLFLCGFEYYFILQGLSSLSPEVYPDENGVLPEKDITAAIGKYAVSFISVIVMVGFHLAIPEKPGNLFKGVITILCLCYAFGASGLYANTILNSGDLTLDEMQSDSPILYTMIMWLLAHANLLFIIGLLGVSITVMFIVSFALKKITETIHKLEEIGSEYPQSKYRMGKINSIQTEYSTTTDESEAVDGEIKNASNKTIDTVTIVFNEALAIIGSIILDKKLQPNLKPSESGGFDELFNTDDEMTRYLKTMDLSVIEKYHEDLKKIDIRKIITEEEKQS